MKQMKTHILYLHFSPWPTDLFLQGDEIAYKTANKKKKTEKLKKTIHDKSWEIN